MYALFHAGGDDRHFIDLLGVAAPGEIVDRGVQALENGLYRADPWSKRDFDTGLEGALAPKARNMVQRYLIEHTRLGIAGVDAAGGLALGA